MNDSKRREMFDKLFYLDEDTGRYEFRCCIHGCDDDNEYDDDEKHICGSMSVDDCTVIVYIPLEDVSEDDEKHMRKKGGKVVLGKKCDVCNTKLYCTKEIMVDNRDLPTINIRLCSCCGDMLKEAIDPVMIKEPDCE